MGRGGEGKETKGEGKGEEKGRNGKGRDPLKKPGYGPEQSLRRHAKCCTTITVHPVVCHIRIRCFIVSEMTYVERDVKSYYTVSCRNG